MRPGSTYLLSDRVNHISLCLCEMYCLAQRDLECPHQTRGWPTCASLYPVRAIFAELIGYAIVYVLLQKEATRLEGFNRLRAASLETTIPLGDPTNKQPRSEAI